MLKRVALLLVVAFVLGVPAWAQTLAAPARVAVATQPAAATPTTRCSSRGRRRSRCRRSSEIKPEHFLPAIKEAIAQNRKEIDAIVNNPQPPTFANTIEALENTGELLSKVQGVFGGLPVGRDQPATAGASTARRRRCCPRCATRSG